MSNLKKCVVVQSNATTKETFITKLVCESIVDLGAILGKKVKKETLYISTAKEAGAGEIVELNMDLFNIIERPYEHPQEGEIMLKWLTLK